VVIGRAHVAADRLHHLAVGVTHTPPDYVSPESPATDRAYSVTPMNTIKVAACRLGMSEKTLYALCARKQIRHVRVGPRRGKLLIPEDAIDEYLKRQTVEVASEADEAPPAAAAATKRPRRSKRSGVELW
jgi:excisionase family DNA binding protein